VSGRNGLLERLLSEYRTQVAEYGELAGQTVYVRKLGALEMHAISDRPEHEAMIAIVLHGLCDQNGDRLFADDQAEAVGQLPTELLADIAAKVVKHNGLQDLETAQGKSEGSPSSDSPSSPRGLSDAPSES